MAAALTAAALLVLCGSAVSALLYFPLLAWDLDLSPRQAALRARLWLAGLLLPPLLALAAMAYALTRQYLHPLYSPHAEYVRPHLCLRPLLTRPDAGWGAGLFSVLCLLLILAALVALVVRLWRGARDSARLRREGTPVAASDGGAARATSAGRREAGPGVVVVESDVVAVAEHRGPGRLVAVSPRLGQLFPGDLGRAILAHELCHARRRDSLYQALAQSALAFQALSPGAYLEYAGWRKQRELRCDLEAAEATSPEAVASALARAEELAGALGEVSPLSAPGTGSVRELAERRERLREAEGAPASGSRLGPVVAVLALLVLVALGVLFRRELADSLQCLAESFLQVL